MKNMSSALLNFLNSAARFVMVDLFTFSLKNGVTLRFCTASVPVTFNGQTWLPAPAGLTRSKIRWVTGIEVDTLDIAFPADSSVMINTVSMLQAAVLGLYDDAKVSLHRLYLRDWGDPVDAVLMFVGHVSTTQVQRTVVHFTVKSDLDRLNVQMPRNLYQSSCSNTLYDAGCTVNVNAYAVPGSVTAVESGAIFSCSTAFDDGYFQMGAIKFTSGANTGLTRTIKSYLGNRVYLTNPLPFDVGVGDAFMLTPGCDKLRNGDCTNKYNNAKNFRGFPYIPVPETAA